MSREFLEIDACSRQQLRGIDILMNNASVSDMKALLEMTEQSFDMRYVDGGNWMS
jgi:hypothetical protein